MIDIQCFDDNQCFKWRLMRDLHPAVHDQSRVRKSYGMFGRELHFKDVKFSVKIRDFYKIEKKNFKIQDFSYENKEKCPVFVETPELKHFCRYCLHAFSIEEILKCHVKDYFKINGKQRIKVPKKVNMLGSNIV